MRKDTQKGTTYSGGGKLSTKNLNIPKMNKKQPVLVDARDSVDVINLLIKKDKSVRGIAEEIGASHSTLSSLLKGNNGKSKDKVNPKTVAKLMKTYPKEFEEIYLNRLPIGTIGGETLVKFRYFIQSRFDTPPDIKSNEKEFEARKRWFGDIKNEYYYMSDKRASNAMTHKKYIKICKKDHVTCKELVRLYETFGDGIPKKKNGALDEAAYKDYLELQKLQMLMIRLTDILLNLYDGAIEETPKLKKEVKLLRQNIEEKQKKYLIG